MTPVSEFRDYYSGEIAGLAEEVLGADDGIRERPDRHPLFHGLAAQKMIGLLLAETSGLHQDRLGALDAAHRAQILVQFLNPPTQTPFVKEMIVTKERAGEDRLCRNR